MEEKECCPKFDPQPWDGITHEWNDKKFLTTSIPQFMHMPLPGVLNKAIMRSWNILEKNEAAPEAKDFLMLAYDPSPWKSILYFSMTKDIPDESKVEKLNGTFISKVFDGPYKDAPKYLNETKRFVETQGKKAGKYYFYYTTCPKCARKYGHNYIVVFAEIV